MRKLSLLILATLLITQAGVIEAQLLNNAKKLLEQKTGGLTEADAVSGIKEALNKGTTQSVSFLSKTDGYFKTPEVKIPFPKDVKIIETKLRAIGLGNQVDNVVLTMNRAAENAATEAKPIFLAAITNMTVTDAINIVKGENDAATKYLSNTTSAELTAKFRPVIKASLDKVQATRYWSEAIKAYNKIPMVKKMNPDLTGYVTQKAIEGLFIMIAKEELNIRKDPVARTSEILKKVFGN